MNIQYFWYLKVIWQLNICILYCIYNLKTLFKWISYSTNWKRRDRRNGKNVWKIKMWILCMDIIYGRVGGGEFTSECFCHPFQILSHPKHKLILVISFIFPLNETDISFAPGYNLAFAKRSDDAKNSASSKPLSPKLPSRSIS